MKACSIIRKIVYVIAIIMCMAVAVTAPAGQVSQSLEGGSYAYGRRTLPDNDPSYASFGGDFYTYSYKAGRAAVRSIDSQTGLIRDGLAGVMSDAETLSRIANNGFSGIQALLGWMGALGFLAALLYSIEADLKAARTPEALAAKAEKAAAREAAQAERAAAKEAAKASMPPMPPMAQPAPMPAPVPLAKPAEAPIPAVEAFADGEATIAETPAIAVEQDLPTNDSAE